MRVLLGLGDVELFETAIRDDLRDRRHRPRRERDQDVREVDVVLGHRHVRQIVRYARPQKAVEVGLHECPGQLPRPIRAKVEVHDGVARGDRPPVADDVRLEQLVATVAVQVAAAQRILGIHDTRRVRGDDGVVRTKRPLPPLVAVHGIEAAVHRCDRGAHLVEQRHRAPRRHVPAVQERVHDHVANVLAPRELDERGKVTHIGVHAASR